MNNFLDDSATFQTPRTSTPCDPYSSDKEGGQRQTLRECVTTSLKDYFNRVDPEHISNLYELVLSEVEAPLLRAVMEHTRSNQSKASVMLGMNRGTLRKKLKQYGMLE